MKPLAAFLRSGVEDPVSKAIKIAHTKAKPFQNLGFVVAAFRKTVGPWEAKGVKDLSGPIMIGRNASLKFFEVVTFGQKQPIRK